jgi:hypothetical protein
MFYGLCLAVTHYYLYFDPVVTGSHCVCAASRHVGKHRPQILANEVVVHTKLGTSLESKVMSCGQTKHPHRAKASRSLYFQRYPSDDMGRPLSSQHTTIHLSNQG